LTTRRFSPRFNIAGNELLGRLMLLLKFILVFLIVVIGFSIPDRLILLKRRTQGRCA
jgi:hypothetical protein